MPTLGQRKIGLLIQTTSWKGFKSYDIFYDSIRKRWPFNTGDCLIEVTAWAGLTVLSNFCYNQILHCNQFNSLFISRGLSTARGYERFSSVIDMWLTYSGSFEDTKCTNVVIRSPKSKDRQYMTKRSKGQKNKQWYTRHQR